MKTENLKLSIATLLFVAIFGFLGYLFYAIYATDCGTYNHNAEVVVGVIDDDAVTFDTIRCSVCQDTPIFHGLDSFRIVKMGGFNNVRVSVWNGSDVKHYTIKATNKPLFVKSFRLLD